MILFDSTEISHLIWDLAFSIPFFLVGVCFAYFFWGFKLFAYPGIAFAVIGFFMNVFSIKYFIEDHQAIQQKSFMAIEGEIRFLDKRNRETFIVIENERFRCETYSAWIKPSQALCNSFSKGEVISIQYIQKGERGRSPPLNRILKISKKPNKSTQNGQNSLVHRSFFAILNQPCFAV